jgi:hypothetical protein
MAGGRILEDSWDVDHTQMLLLGTRDLHAQDIPRECLFLTCDVSR